MRFAFILLGLAGTTLLAQEARGLTLEDELLALLNAPVQGASKRVQRASDSPQAIEVIAGADLRQMGITRIQDALRLLTSVDVIEAGTGATTLGMRGVMQDGQPRTVQILVDGAPLYNVLGAGVDVDLLPVPIDLVDRIEVVRGPSSTLYGANAVAGVVSIYTRRPEDGTHGTLRASAANLETNRGGATLQFGTANLGVSGGYEAASLGNSGQTLHPLGDPNGPATVYDDQHPDATHQGRYFARVDASAGASAFWASAGSATKRMGADVFPWRYAENALLQGGWRQEWSRDFTTEVRFHRVDESQTFAPMPAFVSVFQDPGFAANYKWFNTRTTLLEFQGNWTASQVLHVVFGADQRKGEAFGPARFIGITQDTIADRASGGFLSVDWDLTPSLALSAGARAENQTLGGSRTSPRVALVWKAGGDRVFRAAYLTSSRSPQISETQVTFQNATGLQVPVPGVGSLPLIYQLQPNPGLAPEKTVNYELGYRDRFGAVSLDLTLFRMSLRDLIYQATLPVTVAPPYAFAVLPNQYRNGGDATDKGVEVTLNWLVASGWNLGANATWLDYQRDVADPGNPLDGGKGFSYAPKLKVNTYARFRQGRWSGYAAAQYVGATDVEALLQEGAPRYDHRDAYVQTHLNLGWDLLSGVTLSLYARNANRPFQPQGTTGQDRPENYFTARREAGAMVRWTF
jgi:iron complex outermembrane receptor protein